MLRWLWRDPSVLQVYYDDIVYESDLGEVMCPFCRRSASAPEYIPHPKTCKQAGVTSRWYEQTH